MRTEPFVNRSTGLGVPQTGKGLGCLDLQWLSSSLVVLVVCVLTYIVLRL